jgi:hypothetical protein
MAAAQTPDGGAGEAHAPPQLQLWTVGHSTHELDALLGALKACGITTLLDVRTVPRCAGTRVGMREAAQWRRSRPLAADYPRMEVTRVLA